MRKEGCVFLWIRCNLLNLSLPVAVFSFSGMYLSDLTYVDSAYPSTGSILESEKRSNLMNNILRIISDLQRSCTYGKFTQTQTVGVTILVGTRH